ncbi:MAG: ribose-phosphate pyrophosphokinase [Anaerolineae bacterium]|nr:ribose-phosphate pyrophosphokinase [Anaerolineae bacterium]
MSGHAVMKHERMGYGDIKIYAGTASVNLAHAVTEYLNISCCEHDVITFPNENLLVKLKKSVRGQDCYIIQTTSAPVHRNLMELLITLQTLRLDSASRVTAVIPYLSYAKSDKKDQPRIPITARLIADMIEVAGADRYITFDLHAGQIQGFFSIPGDVISTFYMLVAHMNTIKDSMVSPVVVSVDLGFAKKARNFAERLNVPLAFIEKRRISNDAKAKALTLIGDVNNRDVILVDDEVDTGGSIAEAVRTVKESGARDVYVVFVHPVLSRDAATRLAALPVKQYITTDTIPIPPEKFEILKDKMKIMSIAPLLAEVILRSNEGRSVGEMFKE